jgi:hypothetical protein
LYLGVFLLNQDRASINPALISTIFKYYTIAVDMSIDSLRRRSLRI